MNKSWSKLTKKAQELILYGSDEPIRINYSTRGGIKRDKKDFYEGIITRLERRYMDTASTWIREWLENYMVELK